MAVSRNENMLDDALDHPLDHIDPKTRQRIEQAVLEIFSEREFHRVSLIEVARDARVSLQTIYKYYGSKETLLFASLETWLGEVSARMIDHLQGIETYKDRLRKVFWVVLDYFERNPKVGQLIMSSVYLNTWRQDKSFKQPEMSSLFMKVLSEGRGQGVLTDEVDEKIILDFIQGVTNRLISMWIIRGAEPGGLTSQANTLFDMLWRAISQPGK